MKRIALTLMLLFALAPVNALASSEQVLDDCQDGRIDKKYSAKDLRDALEDMPADLDEYTSCREVIRSAQQGVRGGGGSGPGSKFNDAGGYGALPAGEGGLPLGPDSKPIDPQSIASPEEKREIDEARKSLASAGDRTTENTAVGSAPRSAGIAPEASGADLPTPLIVLLVLVAAGALAALVPRVRELVGRRTP
ncbi:MAG: hypothetical protein AVDCRST_MAG85-2592 [uncultured Solirubrobacteraceae bacterium]|uniref:Secreted protein n=1 Tax=uncultured Solirubrobacteraceae bacterium TaxID=1162706 RepID=A0A6J4T7J8_9ACTN|nr:MAG: hypothetical protein AVDCRST_MAG85-2592 [uncultured Solirubrobacteraceae bacterium]